MSRVREWLDQIRQQMRSAGHEPSESVLVKLADGRIRMFPADNLAERMRRLENELGPVSVAYLLTRGGACVEIQPAAEDSRNAAMVAASLGMTTGALPKVGASFEPSGLVRPPVW